MSWGNGEKERTVTFAAFVCHCTPSFVVLSEKDLGSHLLQLFKVAGSVSNNVKGARQSAPVEVGSPLLDWEEADHFSFEDSDRFEEDSLCSWSSEPESLCNNWRGWKKPGNVSAVAPSSSRQRKPCPDQTSVPSLTELAARCVASHIPFELVEQLYPPVPEQLQLQIAFWSFPESEDDVRLYSCLANGSAEEFTRGENLYRDGTVRDPLQIGFHLSATVVLTMPRAQYNVAVTFDRQKISSCNCTCSSSAHWCSHIVAVCLHRIHLPKEVCLRAPVSESLQRLRRDQLQKFAQYLISELPRQVLPTAQKILDELLSSQPTMINTFCGAPDPTAGASTFDHQTWYLDEKILHSSINKILVKFCVPAPIVFSDVNYLSTSAPPAAAEWSSLLRPLRGREPEGMWNLLSIVREMYSRNDRNAIPLLQVITEEVMACEQMVVWWYSTKASLVSWQSSHKASSSASQHACASLCDELVALWRLAALNPALSPPERDSLHDMLATWHMRALEKVSKNRGTHVNSTSARASSSRGPYINGISESEVFPGFQPAIEACFLEWDDYPIPGVTYTHGLNPVYHSPFNVITRENQPGHQVASSKAVLNNEMCTLRAGPSHRRHRIVVVPHDQQQQQQMHEQAVAAAAAVAAQRQDGNRSSVSSEGFCEDEPNSDSPQSSDSPESQVDTDEAISANGNMSHAESASVSATAEGEARWRGLLARAEGLAAHGKAQHAAALAARLAMALLSRPPAPQAVDLKRQHKRRHLSAKLAPTAHRLSTRASDTLHHASFLLSVLGDFPEHQVLAFRVGLFALELERPPASTKALEVKLNNQEWELVGLLKKLPVQEATLQLARQKAEQIRDGILKCRGPALLPVALASFIFDVLVLSAADNRHPTRLPSDETLAFEAAVTALGLKADVSEAEHPLLCEGTRRQRGDLALSMLAHYRDDPVRLARIMNKLLDREIHQLTKGPMISMYYTNNPRFARNTSTVNAQQGNAAVCSLAMELERVSVSPSSSNTTPANVSTPLLRHKDNRYKGKRTYPCVPNQPSEAFAHFMFELAKSVLVKAGGTSSTSLFTQSSAARDHRGPHRGLHMAAFQLGLYALGIHNCVSANWLSRTYSSHVSWITGQAMDIGSPAILFLIDAWEGHLTPPEAASIADRASAGSDPAVVRAAALLALSALPHAHALNYQEIQRAVLQCKEQSDTMLERACLTVEAAAKGGGVYPEVLFNVARYWHELFLRQAEEAPVPPPDPAPQPLFAYALYPVYYQAPNAYQIECGLPMLQYSPAHYVVPPQPPPNPPQPPAPALRRLLAAYRVGMLALEAQARRVHDDRPANKFARNPPYGEHVKWLLCVAKQLGANHLHQFCVCALNSVVSPFVLYELCLEAAHWLSRGGPHALMLQHLRGALAPLVHKCQQMFIQCIHQKLYHLTVVEYEEFVNIVLSARAAFQLTPEGHTQFKEWLASLRRTKSCKKDLWAQLNAALQTNVGK